MSKRISLGGEERATKVFKTNSRPPQPSNNDYGPKDQPPSMLEPNFIENPSEIQLSNSRFNHLGMERSRPKIFNGNNSQMSRISQ